MLLKDYIRQSVETVSAVYPEKEAKEMVFILLESLIGTKRHTHIIEPSYELPIDRIAEVETAVARLVNGEPLQYVLGTASFYGRDFKVSHSVLIPRPETEILCRTALDLISEGKVSGSRILDLCTGSGCIAWTMALELPGSKVVGADISDGALAVASSQDFSCEISRTKAHAPVFIKADILSDVPQETLPDCDFDIVLSNPPYVMDKEKALMRDNVLEHEPHLALFVPDEDPLVFYRAVAGWASRLLSPAGLGIVEINEALGEATARVFIDAGFGSAEVLQDFSGRDRFVMFRR